jgi:outer membrane protein OmpA-like peptidoglycan-associated protein
MRLEALHMTPKLRKLAEAAAVAALIWSTPILAADNTIHGMIVSHEGNKLVVRVGGTDTPINLTDTTKVQAIIGAVGARRQTHPASDLINGLAVNVDTVQNGDQVDATSVTFKPSDLKTAMAVQAGTAQAKQRAIAKQQENEQRFSQVGQFSEKGHVRVYFASGSVAINAKSGQDLQAFARQAATIPGYVLRVVGHADSTGNAAANQRLSDQRASAVTAYLLQHCNVPPEKMMSAGGLGSYVPIDNNDSSEGKAQNRRVTVFALVSKAAESPSQ